MPGGRPRYEPTAADRNTVRSMASQGVPHETIALCLGKKGIDPKTMRRATKGRSTERRAELFPRIKKEMPGGRPRYEPTAADRNTVRSMASQGVPHETIALCLGKKGIDPKTMRRATKGRSTERRAELFPRIKKEMPGGRPKYEPTEADRNTVRSMASQGVPHETIALCLGKKGIDPKTMRRATKGRTTEWRAELFPRIKKEMPGGRPKYEPTEADRNTVRSMASQGVPHETIALCLGKKGIDAKTMRKHFRRELDTAAAITNANTQRMSRTSPTTGSLA